MKKKKVAVRRPQPMTPKQKKAYEKYLIKVEKQLNDMATLTVKGLRPFKSFVIIMDDKTNGVSRASKDFTLQEFNIWHNQINKLAKLEL
jgi:hypothetical protein